MPAVTRDQAIELLTHEVQEKLDTDELLEVYNEVFPGGPCTEAEADADSWPLIEQLVGHITSGLGIDQMVELWGLVFPKHRDVWYDEEEQRIHYTEGAEAISAE
jgi:hypothetical protein